MKFCTKKTYILYIYNPAHGEGVVKISKVISSFKEVSGLHTIKKKIHAMRITQPFIKFIQSKFLPAIHFLRWLMETNNNINDTS